MLNTFWKQFKSGTDVRGVASEGVANEPVNLTDAVIRQITGAFVLWLQKRTGLSPEEMTLSVGHDSRISAGRISGVVCDTLCRAGVQVLNCHLASTPSMFMTTVDLHCPGAIQITASHHPFNRNGLKFFTRDGGLEGSELSEILQLAEEGAMPPDAAAPGKITDTDYMTDYAAALRRTDRKSVV